MSTGGVRGRRETMRGWRRRRLLSLLPEEGLEWAKEAKKPELERSDNLEEPLFLARYSSALRDRGSRDEMRAKGLTHTLLTLRSRNKSLHC